VRDLAERVREAGKAFGPQHFPNIPVGGRRCPRAKALDVKRPKLHLTPSETRAPGLRQALWPKENRRFAAVFMELAGLEPATSWVRFHPGALRFFVILRYAAMQAGSK